MLILHQDLEPVKEPETERFEAFLRNMSNKEFVEWLYDHEGEEFDDSPFYEMERRVGVQSPKTPDEFFVWYLACVGVLEYGVSYERSLKIAKITARIAERMFDLS